MSLRIFGIRIGDVGIRVVRSLVGIMDKTGVIAPKFYSLASRQISSPTLLWRSCELKLHLTPSKTGFL